METHESDNVDDNTFAKEALLCDIGSKLKQAREAKSLNKEQVLKELKFNGSFLDALESGDWSEMPGEVYALGFLRQYSALLELDFSAEVERIKSDSYELTTPLTYPDAPISPNRTWVIVAALLFIVIMILSNLFSSDEQSIEQVKDVAQVAAPTADVFQDNALDGLSKEEDLTPQESESIRVEPKAMLNLPTSGVDSGISTTSTQQSYHFSAVTDDVWLQVYEESEGLPPLLVKEALLKRGQSFTIESDKNLLLTSGKPTALEVQRNGEVAFAQGQLGEENKVLKLFPLQ